MFSTISLLSSAPTLDNFSQERFERYKPLFAEIGGDPFTASLLAGIAWTESDFMPDAVNRSSNALGMMQIMPFHSTRLGWGYGDWANPRKNIEAGLTILRRHGYRKAPILKVLKDYSGHVTKDPTDYQTKVLTRAFFLLPDFLFG